MERIGEKKGVKIWAWQSHYLLGTMPMLRTAALYHHPSCPLYDPLQHSTSSNVPETFSAPSLMVLH